MGQAFSFECILSPEGRWRFRRRPFLRPAEWRLRDKIKTDVLHDRISRARNRTPTRLSPVRLLLAPPQSNATLTCEPTSAIKKSWEETLRERGGVYGPEDLALLGNIFDGAIAALPAGMRTPANRLEIARMILRREDVSKVELAAFLKLMGVVDSAA